jgi:hypothetical protein
MKNYIIVLICCSLLGCKDSIVKTHVAQSSYNADASKDNEVFVCSYIPTKSILKFDDDTAVEIEDVWVEYLWQYTNINKDISKEDEKNLYLKFKNSDIDIYDFELFYGSGFKKKSGYTGNKLTFKLDKVPDEIQVKLVHKKDTIYISLNK